MMKIARSERKRQIVDVDCIYVERTQIEVKTKIKETRFKTLQLKNNAALNRI